MSAEETGVLPHDPEAMAHQLAVRVDDLVPVTPGWTRSDVLDAIAIVAGACEGSSGNDLAGDFDGLQTRLGCDDCVTEVVWRRYDLEIGPPAVPCDLLSFALLDPCERRVEWSESGCSERVPATAEALARWEERRLEAEWLASGQEPLFG